MVKINVHTTEINISSGCFLENPAVLGSKRNSAMNPAVTVNWTIKIAYTFLIKAIRIALSENDVGLSVS